MSKLDKILREMAFRCAGGITNDGQKEYTPTKQQIANLVKQAKPNIKNHACRFNDGKCVCDCYKLGQDDYQSSIEKLIGL